MTLVQRIKDTATKAARAGIILIIPYTLIGCSRGGNGGSSQATPAPSANVLESKIDGLAYAEGSAVPLATGQQHGSIITFQPTIDMNSQLRWAIYDSDGHKDWSLNSPPLSMSPNTVITSPVYQWSLRNGENGAQRTLEWALVHPDGRIEVMRNAQTNLVWNSKLYDATQRVQEGLDLISYRFQGNGAGPNANPGVHVVLGDSATPEETVAGLEVQNAAKSWAQQYVQNPVVSTMTASQSDMQGSKMYTFVIGTPATHADITELLNGVQYTLPTDGGIIKVIETQKGVHIVAAGQTPDLARLAARAVTLKLNGQQNYDLSGSNTYKVTGTLDAPVVTQQ